MYWDNYQDYLNTIKERNLRPLSETLWECAYSKQEQINDAYPIYIPMPTKEEEQADIEKFRNLTKEELSKLKPLRPGEPMVVTYYDGDIEEYLRESGAVTLNEAIEQLSKI